MIPLWTPRIGGEGSGLVRGIARFSGLDAYQPDPVLTDVFREGDPQFRQSFGDFLFPRVNVGRPFIRIPIHGGGEQYIRHRTERGLRAKHTEIQDTVTTRTFGFSRFGVKAGLDFLEVEFAEPAFRRRENLVFLLSEALRIDQEVIRQELLADANWPATHVIDLTGSEWNAVGGDSAGDLAAGIAVIQTAHPWVQPEDLELVLTFAAKEAALADPTYIAAKASIEFRQATLAEWTSYAANRFERVSVGDLLVKSDINAAEAVLWGEVAVLKIHDNAKQFVTEQRGSRIFARQHDFNGGTVATGWVDQDRTTEWIPAELRARQYVHDYTTGVVFRNMVA